MGNLEVYRLNDVIITSCYYIYFFRMTSLS